MKALYFDGERLWLREEYPMPELKSGWGLIRVLLAGICRTDLEVLEGYAEFRGVLGHEFVGVLERPHDHPLSDKRVVGEINVGCGRCGLCREGLRNHCEQRKAIGIRGCDGAFAEYLTLPLENLHAVPEGLSPEEAVFAEPLAAALEVIEQVPVQRVARAAVLGDGRLGLLVAQVLQGAGLDVTLIGKHEEKLRRARTLGVRALSKGELEPGLKFGLVVEATGDPRGLREAMAFVRPRGIVVLKSAFKGEIALDLAQVVVNEVTLVGSRCGPFERALKELSWRRIRVKELIDGIYSLDSWKEAFDKVKQGALKVLLRP